VSLKATSTVTVDIDETTAAGFVGESKATVLVDNSIVSSSGGTVNIESNTTFTATTKGGSGSADAAVAVSVAISTASTKVTGSSSLTATGQDLTVKAVNKTDITTTGDASASGSAGAGVAIALVFETTEAFVESTGPITAATFTLSADSDNSLVTTAKAHPDGASSNDKSPNDRTKNPKTGQGNANTSDGNVNLAGAIAFNFLSGPTEAHISSSGLTVTTTGEQKVHAASKNKATVEADGQAVSSGSTGVGIAVAVNVVDITNKAFVSGTATLDGSKLTVEALIPATANFEAKATSGAKDGSSTDVAGSLAVNSVTLKDEAYIEQDAVLTFKLTGSDVEVKAESTTESKATAKAEVDGGSGDTTGFGASVAFDVDDITTSARVENNASLTNVHDLKVLATATDTMTNEVDGGTGGGNAITPVAAVSIPNVTTLAAIGTGSPLTLKSGGVLNVSATQTATSTTKAKGASKGNISVGAALALNMVDNTVEASLARSVTGGGDVTIAASGHSVSSAEAEASAEGAKKDESASPKVNDQTQTQRNAGDKKAGDNAAKNSGSGSTPQAETKNGDGNTVKISVAAAISINMVSTTSRATIADGVTVTSTGAVKVSSTANTDAKAKSDGSAKVSDADSGKTSVAVGAAVSVNSVTVLNQASVGNGNVSGTTVTIEAVMKDAGSGDTKHKYEAEATSGASDGKVGVAGAFAGSFVSSTTSAVGKGIITTTSGDLNVNATNDEEVDAKATAKETGGKTAGVGASISVNHLTNTVLTSLDGATVSSAASVKLDSESTSVIKARSLSGAIVDSGQSTTTSNGGGLMGAARCWVLVRSRIPLPIVNGSSVNATSLLVKAHDESDIQAIAGALSAASAEAKSGATSGTSTLVLGASIAINSITNVARSVIDASTVMSSGAVELLAEEHAKILAVTIAAAGALNTNGSSGGGGFALQGAASGSWNSINNIVEALIRNASHVTSGSSADVKLNATDKSEISADGGGVALVRASGSAGAVSLGASIAINEIIANVLAAVQASEVTSAHDLLISAKSEAKIFALTIALAATNTAGGDSSNSSAFNFSLAGAYSNNSIKQRCGGGDYRFRRAVRHHHRKLGQGESERRRPK
jgi:hypothetical protein